MTTAFHEWSLDEWTYLSEGSDQIVFVQCGVRNNASGSILRDSNYILKISKRSLAQSDTQSGDELTKALQFKFDYERNVMSKLFSLSLIAENVSCYQE